MATDKIRIGIIGLGWPGKEHLKGYVGCPHAEITALCDWDEPLLTATADEYGVRDRYTDHRKMLTDGAIDAVSVCVPNYEHAELTIDSLKAGKHVLCEKPPAMSAGEARAMKSAAEEAGKVLMYALVMRFHPETRFLKDVIANGDLGDIYLAKAGYTRRRGIPRGKENWFIDKKRAGGGALIDIGVHALDCVWYLMGTPKPVAISGSAYRKFGYTVADGITYDVDDAALALIKFDNGASLYLEATWAWNLPGGPTKMLAGTKGGAQLDPLRIHTEQNGMVFDMTPGSSSMPDGYTGAGANPFWGETAHFVSVIRGEEELVATPEHGIQIMEMLDAVYTSSDTGKEVQL